MPKITHFDYSEITNQEHELKLLLTEKKKDNMYSPKQKTIDNILNYSKALSIRKSEHLEFIELNLN